LFYVDSLYGHVGLIGVSSSTVIYGATDLHLIAYSPRPVAVAYNPMTQVSLHCSTLHCLQWYKLIIFTTHEAAVCQMSLGLSVRLLPILYSESRSYKNDVILHKPCHSQLKPLWAKATLVTTLCLRKRHPFCICHNLVRCHQIYPILGRNIPHEICNKHTQPTTPRFICSYCTL